MNKLQTTAKWRLLPLMSTLPVLAVLAIACLTTGLFAIASAADATPAPTHDQRLITIHDGDVEKSILTKATSLRKAFDQADIPISEHDLVEPGLDVPLTSSNYEINLYRARPVKIVDGSVKQQIMSPYRTPRQIVEQAGMTLHDEDQTALHTSTDPVTSSLGLTLTIDRATPFTLVLYGKKVQSYTMARTVEEMLDEKDIELGEKDTLSVAKNTAIKKGMTVEIWRNGVQTQTREEKISMPIRQIEDPSKEIGYEHIKTKGAPGEKMVTYEIVMKNGEELKRKVIQSVTTQKPREQVVIVGTKMKNSFDGSFGEALARLRSCEGAYSSNTGNGYYGAYQFDIQTWGGYKGYPHAAAAPPNVQDEKAWETYQRRGWQPWPSCSRSQGLQDIYR